MNTNTIFGDELFSNFINKNNNDSNTKTNSYQDYSYETSSSLNNTTTNYMTQNIALNISQNISSFPLNLINEHDMMNQSQIKNNKHYQHVVLHSLKAFKNSNSLNNGNNNENKNNNNSIIQQLKLISSKNMKEEKTKKLDNNKTENNNIYSKITINPSIMRLISSNDKITKTFPVEYLKEMMCDICTNLYKSFIDEKRKKLLQQNNLLIIRKSLFNFILHLSINAPICEGTLFLTYDIFDRYISVKTPNNDKDLLLIIITSFALAIKYVESSVPNLDELNTACGNRFSKEQINKCELDIMEQLDYNISFPTIFDLFQFIKIIKNMTPKEYNLSLFIFEIIYISGLSLKYNYLCIVEAVYLLVLETGGKNIKNLNLNLNLYNYFMKSDKELFDINKYNYDVNNCLLDVKNECAHIKEKNFDILIKKFAGDKFQNISVDFQLF